MRIYISIGQPNIYLHTSDSASYTLSESGGNAIAAKRAANVPKDIEKTYDPMHTA